MLIRSTILVLALLLFWSCEEVVELDVDFDPQLVVVAEVAPHKDVTVVLSRARPILSQSPTEYVVADQVSIANRRTGQTTELFLQEATKDTLNPNLTVYPFYLSRETAVITSSNNYELNVLVAGEEPISAITTIPQRVDIQSLNLINFSPNNDPRSETIYDLNFDLSFNHQTQAASNYHLVFYFRYIVPVITESDTVYYYRTQIPTVNNLTMSVPYTFDFENGVLIQGQDIPEGRNRLEAELSVGFAEGFSPFSPELLVELRNTNKDYHNYHFNLSRQRSQRDSILSQAIVIPSNINNGLGIFSGYNYDFQVVKLSE